MTESNKQFSPENIGNRFGDSQSGDNTPKICYETAEQSYCTRFETGKTGTYVLPYSAFLSAHLPASVPASSFEILTLVYVTHTVTVRGAQLSALLTVIQKGRAETIRIGGSQASGLVTTPTVHAITVVEGH